MEPKYTILITDSEGNMQHQYTVLYVTRKSEYMVSLIVAQSHFEAKRKADEQCPEGYTVYSVDFVEERDLAQGKRADLAAI
jgi:hypothetical protein